MSEETPEHEHDDDGNCIPPEGYVVYNQPPGRPFDPWNVVGTTLTMVAGLFGVVNQGLNMVAQECWIHARWREERRQAEEQAWYEEQARREMAEAAERIAGMDNFWIEGLVDGEEGTT